MILLRVKSGQAMNLGGGRAMRLGGHALSLKVLQGVLVAAINEPEFSRNEPHSACNKL